MQCLRTMKIIWSMATKNKVYILQEGYSYMEDGIMRANGTSTLITGKFNIIVDTLSPWDKEVLLSGLKQHNLTNDDIHIVVCTHGHVDHIGNLNLFTQAKHIIGYCISKKDFYYDSPLSENEPYKIDDSIEVIATPGHTGEDISVIIHGTDQGIIAVVGDLFEREEDIDNPLLWQETAGSRYPNIQHENRKKIANMANYIIPGHGKMFQVTDEIRQKLSVEI